MCDPKECTTTAWGSSFWDLLYFACVVVVHSSLSQRLIRHEWKASLPDVGLSKSLRTKAQRHFQREQYLIGGRDESPPIVYNSVYLTLFKKKYCTQFCIFNIQKFSNNEYNFVYLMYTNFKKIYTILYIQYTTIFERIYIILYIQCMHFFKECI